MKNTGKVFCIIMGIIGFIFGVAYATTLILIPVAIYCFIGAKMYMDASSLSPAELAYKRNALVGYAVFFSIVAFPFGLLSILPAYLAASNNVKIETPKTEQDSQPNPGNPAPAEQVTERAETSVNTSTKQETLDKLQHLYDEGLITKAELERARKEVEGER